MAAASSFSQKVTVTLDPALYAQLQQWQRQHHLPSTAQALRQILQEYFQPTTPTCPTVLQRLNALETELNDLKKELETALNPEVPLLGNLSWLELEGLERSQLIALAKQLGLYSYKLNNQGLRRAIFTAQHQESPPI
ncbi:hypothetical protein RIF25_10680 [Thermosynechococcaceae cyanobacterium BACA0444]|uniref:Uncharacterized protein n=1 Tax=Pseudocalidococcus azoricus BACA0444 TaxID=2918990 RepID=A0AAE4FSF6_9CYAN|nr:hypothetical protein [Pseudocalidococcus azoricus]MDS3861271.1 hypothetical protein [Pseudocalidococcus azoricus BACA0444]